MNKGSLLPTPSSEKDDQKKKKKKKMLIKKLKECIMPFVWGRGVENMFLSSRF
jgi:hypothetical protein